MAFCCICRIVLPFFFFNLQGCIFRSFCFPFFLFFVLCIFASITSLCNIFFFFLLIFFNFLHLQHFDHVFNPWVCLLFRYPKEAKPKLNHVKSKKAASFHEFARSTNDAWDIDDEDDDDFLGIAEPSPVLAVMHSPSTHAETVFLPELEQHCIILSE